MNFEILSETTDVEISEDYLYPAEYFVLIQLPQAVKKSLLQAA
jgi:hypothetical protein